MSASDQNGARGFWPKTEQELIDYIREQLTADDYNETAEALWRVAVAAFNYAGTVMGVTGFQASYAELRFLAVTRGMTGPFGVLDSEHLLYPQYDLLGQAKGWIEKWTKAVAPRARDLLAERNYAAPAVREHWERLAELAEEAS